MPGRPKVLLSAYACRPTGGSEPGAGWAWAKAAARDHDVWLLTRGKFLHEIDAELAVRPVPGLTVVPLEMPRWILRLRRRRQGGGLRVSMSRKRTKPAPRTAADRGRNATAVQ